MAGWMRHVDERLEELSRRIRSVGTGAGSGATGWTSVTVFQNSWVNLDARTLQYMRDSAGWVHWRGIVTGGTVGTITNVPVGFRCEPRVPAEHHFPVAANSAFGVVTTWNNGDIAFIAGSNAWVDLSTVTYKAAL